MDRPEPVDTKPPARAVALRRPAITLPVADQIGAVRPPCAARAEVRGPGTGALATAPRPDRSSPCGVAGRGAAAPGGRAVVVVKPCAIGTAGPRDPASPWGRRAGRPANPPAQARRRPPQQHVPWPLRHYGVGVRPSLAGLLVSFIARLLMGVRAHPKHAQPPTLPLDALLVALALRLRPVLTVPFL